KRRRHPSPHIDERAQIDPRASLFEQLPCGAHRRLFVRIELAARKRIEPALKHHVRRSSKPENLQLRRVPYKDDRGCRFWSRHKEEYKFRIANCELRISNLRAYVCQRSIDTRFAPLLPSVDHAGTWLPSVPLLLSSSMAEHPAVNRRVVGSSPT